MDIGEREGAGALYRSELRWGEGDAWVSGEILRTASVKMGIYDDGSGGSTRRSLDGLMRNTAQL